MNNYIGLLKTLIVMVVSYPILSTKLAEGCVQNYTILIIQ